MKNAFIKENHLKYFAHLIQTLLLIISFAFLSYFMRISNDQDFQIFRDTYLYVALIYWGIILLLIGKVKLYTLPSLLFVAAYIPIAIYYFNTQLFGVDYETMNEYKLVAIGMIGLFIIDLIFGKKGISLKQINWLPLISFCFMFFCLAVFVPEKYSQIWILFYVVPFFFLKLNFKDWDGLITKMCIGFYLGFLYIMFVSLQTNPYQGGNYYGMFTTIGQFGLYIGAIWATTLYLAIRAKAKYGMKSIWFVLASMSVLTTTLAVFMLNTRTLQVGVITTLIGLFIFVRKRSEQKDLRKRFIFVLVSISILIGGLILSMLLLSKVEEQTILNLQWHPYMKATIEKFYSKSVSVMNLRSYYVPPILEKHPILLAMDTFVSGRIAIGLEFAKYFNWFGNDFFGLQVGDYWAQNCHCMYVQYIFDYGYIGAFAFFAWFIPMVIFYTKKAIHDKVRGPYTFGFLWLVMQVGLLTGEYQAFRYIGLFVTAFLFYGLFNCKLLNQTK